MAVGLLGAAAFAAQAHSAQVLGINAASKGGGLYVLDTATGGATPFAPTPFVVGTGFGFGDPNCIAWDDVNFRAYYTSLGAAGGDRLYRYNAATGTSDDLLTIDAAANGSFYNGAFYTISSNGRLTEVTFDAGGGVAGVREIRLLDGRLWGFGDIAIRASDGVLFGSGTDFSTGGTDLFTVDLGAFLSSGGLALGAQVNYIVDREYELLQLAFDGEDLYGLRTGTGEFLGIDPSDGARTLLGTVPAGFQINDLASIPAPGAGAMLGLGALTLLRRRR